jgi:hypothetical protein
MKKVIVLLASLLMLTMLTGCNITGRTTVSTIESYEVSDLQSRDGVMLRVSTGNSGEMSRSDDEWSSTSYEIMWDGTIKRDVNYMLSGSISDDPVTLREEDYRTLYEFAESVYLNNTFAEYSEQAADGATWTYTYYPLDSDESVCLYRGYTYDNEELCQIQDIVSSYFPEEDYYGPLHTEDQ